MGWDSAGFTDYLLADEAMAPATVRWLRSRLNYAIQQGLDLEPWAAGHEDVARRIARRHLAQVRPRSIHSFNNLSKALNAYARYQQMDLRFKLAPEPNVEPQSFGKQEIRQLLAIPYKRHHARVRQRAIVALALATGMRRSEIRRMDVEDLEPPTSRVMVRYPAKRGRKRRIPVRRGLYWDRGPLAAWLRWRPSVQHDKLWTKNNGTPLTDAGLSVDIQQIRELSNVRFNFVRARHTVASGLHQRGMDVTYIQAYLGHKNIASTMKYVEVPFHDLEETYHSAFR